MDVPQQDLLAERILHHPLNGPAQRARTVLQVAAVFADELHRRIVQRKLDAPLGQPRADLRHQQPRDLLDLALGERMEHDDLVHAVQELRPEDLPDLAHDVVLHVVVGLFGIG